MTDTDKYSEYITLLKENKNLILTGAPGTGKTYLARKIAETMNAKCEFVQFHPSYDYTDFVEGLRPTAPDRNGNIGFERKDGVFKEFCKRAIAFRNNRVPYKDIRFAKSFDDAYNLLVSAIKQHNVTLYSDYRNNKTVLKVTIKEKLDKGREIIQFWKTNKFQDAQIDYLQKIYNYYVSKKQYDIRHEKNEQFVSIIGNTLDYSYYRGIIQGLLDFTDKTSFNESTISFEQCYNELLADINNGLIDKVQLKTGESQKLSVSQSNNIKWQRASDESDSVNCVSLERLLKLFSKYNNVEKVETMKNIDDSIREIIGGANTTYYWAILREVLLRIEAKKTKQKNISDTFVFIIDEINRGEISKIFGELFFSIDPGYRGKEGKVKTQYQNLITDPNDPFIDGFYVPDNVYIIGTMNDIDRSVESMDFAMRRRFAWKEIKASKNISMLDDLDALKNEVVEKMNRLNNAIWNEETNEGIDGLNSAYHIGGAYFRKLKHYLNEDFSNKEEAYRQLWNNHLLGLLFEYLRGSIGAAENMKILEKNYFGGTTND